MLRITIYNEAAVTRFILEGKLMSDWVLELERCWLEAVAARPICHATAMRFELADVTFIDEAGRALLARMVATGAELLAFDVLTKSIVDEIVGAGS